MEEAVGFGDWQTALDVTLREFEDCEQFQAFAQLKTNRERIHFIIRERKLRSIKWLPAYFETCAEWHGKSESVAQVWKNKGNKLFQQGKYQQAVELYTHSCISAPADKGNLLAFSLGNRSAALFHLGHMQTCLIDIDRAMVLGFPAASKHKLLVRKTAALVQLGHLQQATQSVCEVNKFMSSEEFGLEGRSKDVYEKEVAGLEESVKNLADMGETVQDDMEKKSHVDLYRDNNAIIIQASKAVTVNFSPEKTRFLMANEKIPQGATVIVEKPFSSVLLPDHYESHCHHCCGMLPLTALGCYRCCLVRFCDEECRRQGWEQYHRIECKYMDLLHSVGIAHLSLRTVLKAGQEFLMDFLSNPSKFKASDGSIKGLNSAGIYDGSSYPPVYELLTHEESIEAQDLLQYSMTAVLLLYMLIHSEYFEEATPKAAIGWTAASRIQILSHFLSGHMEPSATDIPVEMPSHCLDMGGLLLRHILQLVCNAHAITAFVSTATCSSKSSILEELQQVRIATAIYPTASLMNHSCDPSIVPSFIGDILVVKTLQELSEGDEIFICYGPHSRRMKREDRQHVLWSQYHFMCDCTACSSPEVWSQKFGAYKCSSCSNILSPDHMCVGCGRLEPREVVKAYQEKEKDLNSSFNQALDMLKKAGCTGALDLLLKCQEERKKILYKDHRDLAFGEDALARCYASLGDFHASADHLNTSMEFAKLMYGGDSTEFAHELLKLAEVLFNAERFAECQAVCQRAADLFGNLYNPSHKSVCQVNDLKLAAEVALTPTMQSC